ncbi:carboxypeptidase regulatory-like domain-containing protein [Sphingomonas corticis]|jgi:hypothetical protein|uniref:Carboxypeptidase regulatory-like domain-containing protein n=1 Tax=Sphingomonas corticis TaxID=2722791 RepID=A0ABX1CLP4_9SPHN|nr:carboxypeptidase regulatory-like domain-containing protein [Sphingomonas corticis]NJR78900.1 carboxypeptidase regulatory-like domain-containing protein [Sphingomonas corticis]
MTAERWTAALLALAVAVGWIRLIGWRRAAPARPPAGRLALLLTAQPVLAVLLFLTLYPPPTGPATDPELAVATRGASPGSADIALPEAPRGSAPVRVPDLATALRAHPGTRRIRVLGQGLEPRDRDVARTVGVAFVPAAPRPGLVALAPPARVAPGAPFRVGGQVAGAAGARVELLDPAGRVVDAAGAAQDGSFVLQGAARVPGVALFRVRLRGGEAAPVPVVVTASAPVRVLYLAGAPGPEVKYWRRWAADAGIAATVSQTAGAGIDLGEHPSPLTAATLARFDLVVLDDRRWAGLGGGERGALAAAVRGGLGLLLRVTAPLPAGVRAGWAALGAPVGGAGRGGKPARLGGADVPVLTRWDALAPGGVTLGRDAAGVPFAAWRARGLGRVGVWTLADAAALVPSGHGERFDALSADAVATLARPAASRTPSVSDWPVVGERTTVCGAGPGAQVVAPDGTRVALLPDGGCAGYWPRTAGWHVLADGSARLPFHVTEAAAIPGLRAADRRAATLRLAAMPGDPTPAAAAPAPIPGASWPWLLAFLAVAAALWWFERRGRGAISVEKR